MCVSERVQVCVCAVMEVPMPNLLVALWMKSVLNWVALTMQKGHLSRSFMGIFCVAVAVSDALLHLTLTGVFLAQDVQVAQVRLTRYHVCLLVRAASSVHGILHWPVFILAGLDVLWSRRWRWQGKTLAYVATVVPLWALAVLYVLRAPDPDPDPHGADHVMLQVCHVICGSQSLQVAWLSMVMVVGATCFTHLPAAGGRAASAERLRQSLRGFLSNWRSFIFLLLFLMGGRTPVPPYLDLNVVWLSFIHSLQSALALTCCTCVFCSHEEAGLQHQTATTTSCYLKRRDAETGLMQRIPG